ncbi:MAG TPA: HIT family protein [Acidimicrobiia bacterium]|nr:HIT family protein [Acidimicrobiia bacterium]
MAACLFCAIAAGTEPAHVVLDTPAVLAFLDHRPVFKGHVLVIPREHVVTLPELDEPTLTALFLAVQRCASAMVDGLGAQGSWVAQNNVVSQAVPHVHVHVVPRTKGDGLRGFFWPRQKYVSDEEMAEYASRLRASLDK